MFRGRAAGSSGAADAEGSAAVAPAVGVEAVAAAVQLGLALLPGVAGADQVVEQAVGRTRESASVWCLCRTLATGWGVSPLARIGETDRPGQSRCFKSTFSAMPKSCLVSILRGSIRLPFGSTRASGQRRQHRDLGSPRL